MSGEHVAQNNSAFHEPKINAKTGIGLTSLDLDPHLTHQQFHVVPSVFFRTWSPQQVGGMISHQDLAVTKLMELPAKFANRLLGLQNGFGSHASQTADKFGLNNLQLPNSCLLYTSPSPRD